MEYEMFFPESWNMDTDSKWRWCLYYLPAGHHMNYAVLKRTGRCFVSIY